MAKTLFYTLILSGMSLEDAYNECAVQNVYAEEELQELHALMHSKRICIAA